MFFGGTPTREENSPQPLNIFYLLNTTDSWETMGDAFWEQQH
jgi:hypothetical protein